MPVAVMSESGDGCFLDRGIYGPARNKTLASWLVGVLAVEMLSLSCLSNGFVPAVGGSDA